MNDLEETQSSEEKPGGSRREVLQSDYRIEIEELQNNYSIYNWLIISEISDVDLMPYDGCGDWLFSSDIYDNSCQSAEPERNKIY